MSKATAVKCGACGWRSRRVGWTECECEYGCNCVWGRCPKCNAAVYPVEQWQRWKEIDQELESLGVVV